MQRATCYYIATVITGLSLHVLFNKLQLCSISPDYTIKTEHQALLLVYLTGQCTLAALHTSARARCISYKRLLCIHKYMHIAILQLLYIYKALRKNQ